MANIQITYGETNLDFSTLPEQSLRAMVSRGVSHFLGNEQAAKIGPKSPWYTKFEKENKRPPTEDEIKAKKASNLAAAVQALVAGTVGTARGPKVDPIEAEMERMAERDMWDRLAGMELCKKNKKPDDDDEFTFDNGSTFTFGKLVEMKLAKDDATLRAAATKKIENERKAREKAQAQAKAAKDAAGGASFEALGV